MKTPSSRRGAALVIVLSIIILATIIVVGLTTATRMERSASHYNLERTRAELFAQVGVDYGRALLMTATDPTRFWVSAPGRIFASATNTMGSPTNLIVLSSGPIPNTNGANFNRLSYNSNDRAVNPSGTDFAFNWIYVNKDGSHAATTNSNTVGRFAFWVDDESARINLNTASGLSSAPTDSNPSQIALNVLPGMSAIATPIANEATVLPFNSPYDALGRNAGWTNALSTNRFFLTHYSQALETDPWGRPRRIMTTRSVDVTNGRPYFSILNASTNDPGTYAALDQANLQAFYTNLVSDFMRTNWPYASGKGYNEKYGTSGVLQMAVDLIEYVRAADSTNAWPQPIVADVTTNSLALLPGSTSLTSTALNSAVIGTTRRPMITQVGIHASTNTNAQGYIGEMYVQMYLPSGYDPGSGNAFDNWALWSRISSSGGGTPIETQFDLPSPMNFTANYAVAHLTNITIPAAPGTSIPASTFVRLAILRDKSGSATLSNLLDIAPLKTTDSLTLTTGTDVTSYVQINDPRLNKTVANWGAATNLSTNAPMPAHTITFPPATPMADGSIISQVFRIDSPVVSVGELGYLPTGVGSTTNAPWRSLRLQTNSGTATNVPPDWALLDLFSAPIHARYRTSEVGVVGRINLNALVATTNAGFSRTNVLKALLTNSVSSGALTTVISNVANLRLGNGGNFGSATNNTNFVSVGQLSEVIGIGDQGEAGEAVIRKVAGLATVQSGVFSIYSTGQAIQITLDGKMVINGERTVRAMVERYMEGGVVKYRIVHWSDVY